MCLSLSLISYYLTSCHVTDTQDSESDSETQSEDSRDSNYDSETTDSYSDDDYENDEIIHKQPKKGKTTKN
jgi:hypothetical protein